MKTRAGYYFWIISLTVVLMLLILAAQVFTINNINGLKTGNQEAAVTFTINNRLQEIVNTSALLQSSVLKLNLPKNRIKAVTDSLAVMGYNASVLEKLNIDTATQNNFRKLNAHIGRQLAISFKNLEAADAGKQSVKKIYADSLAGLNLSDSIYKTAIAVQESLEFKLKRTFDRNMVASQKLSTLNKIFALIAIAAILILGTIIINRHLRQVSLIKALEKANAEVKKSALIKEQFLANMSHEIRTPLNAIKGFSRLMQQTTLTEEQQKFSDIIENSSNNLLHLVNDILDIAKIEAGKMLVEQKEFDLKRMLQTLEYMFLNTARTKQLAFTWKIDAAVPQFLHGDPDRIYQVLINLVSNAFKFTTSGFVDVSVSNSGENEKEFILEFNVEDTGVGIPLRKQELIFERFQQLEYSDNNVQKGTGLGLAIVKNIVLLLGGSVAVSSSEGRGSVFNVRLPFPKNYIDENQIVTPNDLEPVAFNGARVLVAEDNKVNQLLISRLLNQYQIHPVIKENGMDVLEVLKTQSFDLLLLDIQMPKLDGYKTSAAIRKTGYGLPVVAMTAYVMDAEKEKCKAAGMNGYLPKPIEETDLRNILIKYLGKFSREIKSDELGTSNEFLLQLAGGDEKIAGMILKEVIKEIPAEIKKLNKIVSEKSIDQLPAACHHLISSISPLGGDSSVMQKITAVQKMISENKSENLILRTTEQLKSELETIYAMLTTVKHKKY